MGIFDFLKKKVEPEKVKFEDVKDVKSHLLKIKARVEENQSMAIMSIKEKINSYSLKFDEHIEVLQNIDLSDKKAEEKVKQLVKGSVNGFLDHLIRLKRKFNDFSHENFESIDSFETSINSALQEFETKSYTHYERATFLVGDEIADVLKTMNSLSKELKGIVMENRETINAYKELVNIKKLRRDIKLITKEVDDMSLNIDNSKNKVNHNSNEIVNLEKKKKDYKESEEYKEILNLKSKVASKETKLKELINNMRLSIDFKEIARVFHSSTKDMELIKEFKTNFYEAFTKDDGDSLLRFFDENKEADKKIIGKVNDAKALKKEIFELSKSVPQKNRIDEIESEISKINEIISLEEQNIERLNGLKEEKESQLSTCKKELKDEIKSCVENFVISN